MQQTCSRCGGLLVPGASACNYCGLPVPSNTYPQQNAAPSGWQPNNAPPPGTQYGYTQGNPTSDPYAAQYGQAAPPPVATQGPSNFGPPPFAQPSQPSSFGPPPTGAYGSSPFGSAPQPPQKRSPAALIGVIVLIVIVVAGLGTGGYFLLKNKNTTTNTNSTPTTVPALYQANLTSDPGSWDCTTSNNCSFHSDGYHIQDTQTGVVSDSMLFKQTFDNAVIDITGVISKGDPQNAGLAIEFRVPQDNHLEGYGFFIYDDGTFDLLKWDSQGKSTTLIDTTSSSALHGGLQQSNDLKIVMNGSHFTFYANNQQIIDTNDSVYSNGYIGLAADGQGTEVIFSNLTVTKP
jgi:3-keto-disaccharide hydrolase